MTEQQRLFLVQARTDFAVFELFRRDANWPSCHALHYLQMATELLGKAHAWRHGYPRKTHRAFVGFLRSLSHNRQAQDQLGFERQNENWMHVIRKSVPLAQRVEDLAPALDRDGPNPEYPRPSADPTVAPAEHRFEIWEQLQSPRVGNSSLCWADYSRQLRRSSETAVSGHRKQHRLSGRVGWPVQYTNPFPASRQSRPGSGSETSWHSLR